jgi:thiol:disulfide interchange protein DsbD
MKDQYREALERARREGKLLFVNFTGVACANCHWMEANMLSRPEIAAVLQGFVLVELFTDRADAVSQANQNLQLAKFQTAATPLYAILDPDEKVVAKFEGKTSDVAKFLSFLNSAPPPAGTDKPTGGTRWTSLDGKSVDTSGKVVVVNFWATWCVPCIQEIPSFNKMHKELGGKGVVVLGVAMDDEGAARVEPFLKKHPMDYAVALGSDAIRQQYKVEDLLPVTIVFDRAGKQIKRFEGFTPEADLQAAVQQAL